MNKVAEFLSKLLAGGVLKDLTGLLDEIITNKEERQALLNELKKTEYAHIEAIDAIKAKVYEAELKYKEIELNTEVELRKQAVKLATESTSWLGKNIAPILALISTSAAVLVYLMVIMRRVPGEKNPDVSVVVNDVTNLVFVVFGFYFGSSIGSRLKDLVRKKRKLKTKKHRI